MTEALPIPMDVIEKLAARAAGINQPGGDKRLKLIVERILTDLFRTMVAFNVTPDEMWKGIAYVGEVGRRQEAGLLAPGLGIEHFVDIMQDAADTKAGLTAGTPRTIEGPLYVTGAPVSDGTARLDDGSDAVAEPLFVSGVVRGQDGKPVAGALVEVWHANRFGFYSHFDPTTTQTPFNLRGGIKTDANGRYSFRSIVPLGYGCPPDGPTAGLLTHLGRHSQRPAHVHFFISAPGMRKLTTQFNIAGDPLTYDDFAFATRDGLVAEAKRVSDPAALATRSVNKPFSEIIFDFELQREIAGVHSSVVHRDRAAA